MGKNISFYRVISEFYDEIFPFSNKKRSFFRTLVKETSGSFLDIGCATGDLIFFAESLGLDPIGLDNDTDLIHVAEGKKAVTGSSAEFVKSDMRRVGELFETGRFDIITCMGNTIAHLRSSSEIGKFFKSNYKILNQGGVFSGQLVNYENGSAGNPGHFNEIETGDFKFIRQNKILGNGKVEFSGELILKGDGTSFCSRIELYPADKDLIETELKLAGFSSISFFGGFDLGKYKNNSEALIFKAGK